MIIDIQPLRHRNQLSLWTARFCWLALAGVVAGFWAVMILKAVAWVSVQV
jgi:hypothetical protein